MSGSKVQGKITYIDVDSTYRDRHKYPNPADFKVPYANIRNKNDINGAYNILSDSYPYYQWQWGCKGVGTDGTGQSTVVSTITGGSLEGTLSELLLSDALTAPSDASVDSIASNFTTTNNYFSGLMLTIDEHGGTGKTQKSRIVSHDAVENVVDVSSAYSSGGANDLLLETSDWSITNPSTTTKIFIPGGSSKFGNYVGDYYECLMYGGTAIDSTINFTAGAVSATHTGTIAVSADPRTIFFVGSTVYKSDGTSVGIVTANASGTITIGGGTLVDINNDDLYHYPNPSVHQFKKIISYDGKTRLATLESFLSLFDSPDGAANKSGTHSTTYLHRLRKSIPILPIWISSSIATPNIPLIQGATADGGIYKVSVNNGGSGYSIGNVLTLSGGSNGKVKVTVVNGGVITGVELIRAGSGYSLGGISTTTGVVSETDATGISSTDCKINILGVGTTIDIEGATGASTVNGKYTNDLFYYPAFASGGGTASTDPSAAQDFIPQSNSVNTDSPGSSYSDSHHCSFPILAHTYTTSGGNANELVIKSISSTERGYIVANKEFNILDFKEDGVQNIVNHTYIDPKKLHNYYEINLLNLILPNSALKTGPGGFLGNHSYIMVEFFSESKDKTSIYNTNNPHLEDVMFKCMVVDSANPSTVPFVKFRGAYPIVSQFSLEESISFRVIMPNGQTLTTISSDSVPPVIPKKDLQVSATFMLKRIDVSDK
jgi:hypothetical protein